MVVVKVITADGNPIFYFTKFSRAPCIGETIDVVRRKKVLDVIHYNDSNCNAAIYIKSDKSQGGF